MKDRLFGLNSMYIEISFFYELMFIANFMFYK